MRITNLPFGKQYLNIIEAYNTKYLGASRTVIITKEPHQIELDLKTKDIVILKIEKYVLEKFTGIVHRLTLDQDQGYVYYDIGINAFSIRILNKAMVELNKHIKC